MRFLIITLLCICTPVFAEGMPFSYTVPSSSGSSGASGTVALTSTYVGYGSASNTLTGNSGLTYIEASNTLLVGGISSTGVISATTLYAPIIQGGTISGTFSAPGSDGQIIFNNAGSMAASPSLTLVSGTGQLVTQNISNTLAISTTTLEILSSSGGLSFFRPAVATNRLSLLLANGGAPFLVNTNGSTRVFAFGTGGSIVGTSLPTTMNVPSATWTISGTLLVTSNTTFSGLSAGTATNNLCITATGLVISSTTLSGCLGVSDPALKKDIRPLTYGLAEVLAVDTVTYKDIRPGGSPATQIGFLAYSVDRNGKRYRGLEPVMPELVDQQATFYNGHYYKGVIYERAITVAYKAIQEQQAEIEALKAAIKELGFPPKPWWKLW